MTTDSPSYEISFDDVAATAGGLQHAGTPVTFDALRAAFPDASPTVLARQLRAWRAEHERLPAPAPATLPAALAADLAAWAQQHAEQAGAGPRAAMAQLQDDLDAALAEAGRLEDEVDSATNARDAAQAAADERSEEIERLMAELRNARQVAMDALVGKAKDQLAIDG